MRAAQITPLNAALNDVPVAATPPVRMPGVPGYRMVRRLGQGGMATVYLAVQESLDRQVAIKVMASIATADDGSWDTGMIQPGGRASHTFASGGGPYHCAPHPFMKGVVVVR